MTVGAVAVWRGRDEERLATAVILANWALSMMVYKARSEETQWAVLAVDFCQFVIFMWLALRSRAFWPLFLAGFTLLQQVTHIAHALDERVSGWAYITAERVWSYLMLFTIGYAAWTAPYRARDQAGVLHDRGDR